MIERGLIESYVHVMQVFACDNDAGQLEMAQRNCEAYGAGDKVSWLLGDVFESLIDKVDAVFLSPPWGGPGGATGHDFDATHALPGVSWSVLTHFRCVDFVHTFIQLFVQVCSRSFLYSSVRVG